MPSGSSLEEQGDLYGLLVGELPYGTVLYPVEVEAAVVELRAYEVDVDLGVLNFGFQCFKQAVALHNFLLKVAVVLSNYVHYNT